MKPAEVLRVPEEGPGYDARMERLMSDILRPYDLSGNRVGGKEKVVQALLRAPLGVCALTRVAARLPPRLKRRFADTGRGLIISITVLLFKAFQRTIAASHAERGIGRPSSNRRPGSLRPWGPKLARSARVRTIKHRRARWKPLEYSSTLTATSSTPRI